MDFILKQADPNNNSEKETDGEEPLLLSPLIQKGLTEEAQTLAAVNLKGLLESKEYLESYSGYFTVNSKYDSNLFFWFFPSIETPRDEAPVILWLNGGPGASSMFTLFAGHGPILVDDNQELQRRKISWNLNHSVVYIDSPVGTGFSFTNHEDGYAKTLDDVVRDLYEGMLQFFALFPTYRAREFFIAGQSCAGKYAPALAYKIHKENSQLSPKSPNRINLKGMAMGASVCDPISQMDYGNYLYNIGLIDETEKIYFDTKYEELCDQINKENWSEAHKILQYLMIGWPRPIVSRFDKVSGFTFNSNYLHENMPPDYANYISWVQRPEVRSTIHVGSVLFGKNRDKVYSLLGNEFPKSVKPLVEFLLDKDYKVLFYASQLDVVVPHTGISRFINSLNWKAKEKYLTSGRKIWRTENIRLHSETVSGYVKECDNLIYLIIRNAGHISPHDKPEECFNMITRFTRNFRF